MKKKDYNRIAKNIADKIILLNKKYSRNYSNSSDKSKNNELSNNLVSKV